MADPWFQRFEWLEPLAQGGMGTVYLVEDRSRNRTRCVVKQLRCASNDKDDISEAQRLFKREAELLRALDHPGIVRFLDNHMTVEGQSFLVMDYVNGNNLETILQNFGPFSQDDAVKVGIQICEVLEYLHEHDPPIIYRDLKPSNLMLTPEGQIVFIDFGIARVFMPKQSATRVVTAGYSPPEQYFGKPEIRSDLYALGATMAHLLTGVRPRPLNPSVPSHHVADVLPNLDRLIRELTAHSPEDRPMSARLVRHRLYRIYQEIYPDFEIPEDVFAGQTMASHDDQFISQKIMRSGLKAASSVQESLPSVRGAENEVYSDEDMPSGIRKIFEGLHQKLSSSRIPVFTTESITRTEDDFNDSEAVTESDSQERTRKEASDDRYTTGSRRRRPRSQRETQEQMTRINPSIWQKLVDWVTSRRD